MTNITFFDEIELPAEDTDAPPPLCLVHYFGAGPDPPEQREKALGIGVVGRVAERRGNLIVLEFVSPPKSDGAKRSREKLLAKIADALFLLLLLLCVIGCLAAFRF